MKKKIVFPTLIVLVLAFTVGAMGAQAAHAAPSTQVSAGWMPFAGSLYDFQTDSLVNINGLVHIVARWHSVSSSQVQVDISANLPAAGVSVTTDTGIPYSASGAGQSKTVFFPTDPLYPTDPLRMVVPSFLLVTVGSDRPLPPSPILPPNPVLPPNPIQPFAFAMQFDLVFSAAGVLDLDASTVKVTQVPDIDGD
jgi:hypothetical protein